METVLQVAWRQYRGWAGAARASKAASDRDLWVALGLVCISALLGSAASVPVTVAAHQALAVLTVAFGAGAAWFGRYVLDPGRQGAWIVARAAAEMIQSECYRFAAKSPPYAGGDSAELLRGRVEAAGNLAREKGANIDVEASQRADKPAPPDQMTMEQYREGRIGKQRVFYAKSAKAHLETARRTRWLIAGVALIGALLGVFVAVAPNFGFAPFIATCTTITTALASYGILQRHLFLADQYAEMVSQLDWIDERAGAPGVKVSEIAEAGEDLLNAEHAVWVGRMQRLIATQIGNEPAKR